MTEQAIRKINEEMQKNPNDAYTEIIGHYVIDRCEDKGAAKKIVKGERTLKGAMDAVLKKAQGVKRGSVAVLTPGAVFGAVDAYFGFRTDEAPQRRAMATAPANGESQTLNWTETGTRGMADRDAAAMRNSAPASSGVLDLADFF